MEGKSLISEKTPPFVILTFTDQDDCGDDRESLGKFVQLQKGAKKESYGDLLKDYMEVKNFCDTIFSRVKKPSPLAGPFFHFCESFCLSKASSTS